MTTKSEATTGEGCSLTVFHDGSCPLCAREMEVYRKSAGADALRFVDVSAAANDAAPGLSREAAMRRFHILTADGRLVSGGPAFVALWLTLPGWRWLGRAFDNRVGRWLVGRAYDAFLPVRPFFQRMMGKRA
jgi:predicted DCC family thiol-disulfide oxidoreductase YuxK